MTWSGLVCKYRLGYYGRQAKAFYQRWADVNDSVDLFGRQIDQAFWDSTVLPAVVTSFQSWIYGAWGATIAGWGIFLSLITYIPFKQREKWAWNCLVVGMGVWFVLDTGISWQYGVSFNVVFNIAVVLATGIPLVFSRKAFLGK